VADKINWLPAALGAAIGAGIVLARLPDADRRITAAAGLTGAALGYGIADFIEDRSLGRIAGKIKGGAKKAAAKVTGGAKKAANKAKDVVGDTASGVRSGVKGAGSKVKKGVGKAVRRVKFW